MEVKSAEGVCSEAVISKLTDASWYTVGKCRHNSAASYRHRYGLIFVSCVQNITLYFTLSITL